MVLLTMLGADDLLINSLVLPISFLLVDYFEDLLTKSASWRPKSDGLAFDSLDPPSASWSKRLLDENEVFQVFIGMVKDKAPSLDGFFFGLFLEFLGRL